MKRLAVLFIFLSFIIVGCADRYVCPDGSTVSNPSSCNALEANEEPTQAHHQYCEDGTPPSECSNIIPKYCSNGVLVDSPTLCGCPSGFELKGRECELLPPPYFNLISIETIPLENLEGNQQGYNLSTADSPCLVSSEAVDAGKKLLLMKYRFSNSEKELRCIDVYQIKLIDENGYEYGPRSIYGVFSCTDFPIPVSNMKCLDGGEQSKELRVLFILPNNASPTNISYSVDYQVITQPIQ